MDWRKILVWLCHEVAGVAFVVSGWAKLVDPAGFVFKIGEYLEVWGVGDIIPSEGCLLAAVALSLVEMITGVLLMTGSMRRGAVLLGLALMAGMLPLTTYITVVNPVEDCGCFGDLWHVSNSVTLLKNLIISAALLMCLLWAQKIRPIYQTGVQWLVITLTAAYGLILAFFGWQVQPVVDFRPYRVGTSLLSEGDDAVPTYTYERDGKEQEFTLNDLPDSTWTFVETKLAPAGDDKTLAVFDGDDDVTEDVLADCDSLLLFVVAEPATNNLLRARLANETARHARLQGYEVIGLIGASGAAIDDWQSIAMPDFDVYSADPVILKQLVRGQIGLVKVTNDTIRWKRNFTALDPDFLTDSTRPFDTIYISDDGHTVRWITTLYLIGMLLLLGWCELGRLTSRLKKHTET